MPGRSVCATAGTTITGSPAIMVEVRQKVFFPGWDPFGMLPPPYCLSIVCGAKLWVACQTGALFAPQYYFTWFFENWFIFGLSNSTIEAWPNMVYYTLALQRTPLWSQQYLYATPNQLSWGYAWLPSSRPVPSVTLLSWTCVVQWTYLFPYLGEGVVTRE